MTNKIISMSIGVALSLTAFAGCDSGTRKRTVNAGLNAPPAIAETKLKPVEIATLRRNNPSNPGLNAAPTNSDNNVGNANDPTKGLSAQPDSGNPAADPNGPRQKADAEATAKDFGGGVLGQPFEVYFKAKDTLAFGQMKQALDLYKVEHGVPKSHEEFMEKIIKANQIQLPELGPGNVYEFDPKTGVLMVAPAADE